MHWPHQIDADWKAISAPVANSGLDGLHFIQTDRQTDRAGNIKSVEQSRYAK